MPSLNSKPQAILLSALVRTNTDLLDLLHYFSEPVTLLVPTFFYSAQDAKYFSSELVSVVPLQTSAAASQARGQTLAELTQKAENLDLSATPAAEFAASVQQLLAKSLPVAVELIDALEEAHAEYNILGFFTSNEAFQRERLMRDWCLSKNIPSLHVNHGLILGVQGGAYGEFATTALTNNCPNEALFLQASLEKQAELDPSIQPPKMVLTGMPTWDKYALLLNAQSKAAFKQRLGLQAEQPLITFFPTIRNLSYANASNAPDPHLTGVEEFIAIAGEIAQEFPEVCFVIKDRPGNQQFMQEFVELQRTKHKLSAQQLIYAFDFAEPYVAYSTLTIAPKSTIAGEAVVCQVPHVNLINAAWEAMSFSPEAQMAHLFTTELAEFLQTALNNPEQLAAIQLAQQESDALVGPARDFCSSLRVAKLMAELINKPEIATQIEADLNAWQAYLQLNPAPSRDDLLEDGANPLRFHWRNVEKLLQFDERFNEEVAYNKWLQYKNPPEVDGQLMAERMQNLWHKQPSFHLIYVVEESMFAGLADSLDALDSQIFKHFGVSILSTSPCPNPELLNLGYLQWLEAEDPFSLINSAINSVETDWVLIAQPGDELMPDALFNLADYANFFQDWLVIYADEDQIFTNQDGQLQRHKPNFKPDFNYDYLLSTNYLGQCVALRRDAILALEGLSELAYVQNEDFVLRLAERMTIPAIGHLPFIANSRSDLLDAVLASETVEINAHLVRAQHLQRLEIAGEVLPGLKPHTFQISYTPKVEAPEVAILMPITEVHEALMPCLQALLTTTYPNWQLYIGATKGLLAKFNTAITEHEKIHLLPLEDAGLNSSSSRVAVFEYLAAQADSASFLCLLENDVHLVQPNWLEKLVMHGQRPQIGLVAPRLAAPNGRVFSAGQILGKDAAVGDFLGGFHLEQDVEYQPRAWCDQNFSALNSSCVLLSQENWRKFGLNPKLPFSLYLADLGLRMQVAGLRLHWTPYATMACHGFIENLKHSKRPSELDSFYADWFGVLLNDPAHNPNLSLEGSANQPLTNLITSWHPLYRQQPRILLVPLHLDGSQMSLLGSLGYYAQQLEKQEFIRVASGTVDLFAKDDDLLGLIELARADADMIIFVGEEVGTALGTAQRLKQLTNCKLGVYVANTLEQTSWQEFATSLDVVFSATENAPAASYLPTIEEGVPGQVIQGFTAEFWQCLHSILQKS